MSIAMALALIFSVYCTMVIMTYIGFNVIKLFLYICGNFFTVLDTIASKIVGKS